MALVVKVSFHLKEEYKVLVTIISPKGKAVNLLGIWLTDFLRLHLRVAMAYSI